MTPTITQTPGERIRGVREELNLTQQDVADAVGVSRAAVAQWESGDTKSLKPEHLFKLARKFCKAPEWLVTGRNSEMPADELLELFEKLSGDAAMRIFDYILYHVERSTTFALEEERAQYITLLHQLREQMAARRHGLADQEK
jgi:transcriptional regulator with XRE-family HTH domain